MKRIINYTNMLSIIAVIYSSNIIQAKNAIPDAKYTKSASNQLCILFNMYDTFGDGWHSTKLRIADEYGHDSLHSLVVGDDHLSDVSYCFDTAIAKNGRTVTVGVSGLQPIYGWEVYWTATIDGDDGSVYMGTYNTFMTFEFRAVNNKEKHWISLKSYHNLLTEKKDCMSCSAGDDSVAESGGSGTTSSTKSNSNKGQGNSKKSDKSKRILSETAQYELFGDSSWYSLNGYGTAFDISSVDGLTRYYSGGLCLVEYNKESKNNKNTKDKSSDNGKRSSGKSCDLTNLTPGEYRWRVSGAYDEDRDGISWKFCGVEGGASTEVLFAIDDLGQCTPLKTHIYDGSDYSSPEISLDTESSSSDMHLVSFSKLPSLSDLAANQKVLWTIYFDTVITGFHDTLLVKQNVAYLPDLVKRILNSITIVDKRAGVSETRNVTIVSWTGSGSIFDLNSHISFKFEATLIPESYGYDSSSVDTQPMQLLEQYIQSYMEMCITSGIFMKELISLERTTTLSGIQSLSNNSLTFQSNTVISVISNGVLGFAANFIRFTVIFISFSLLIFATYISIRDFQNITTKKRFETKSPNESNGIPFTTIDETGDKFHADCNEIDVIPTEFSNMKPQSLMAKGISLCQDFVGMILELMTGVSKYSKAPIVNNMEDLQGKTHIESIDYDSMTEMSFGGHETESVSTAEHPPEMEIINAENTNPHIQISNSIDRCTHFETRNTTRSDEAIMEASNNFIESLENSVVIEQVDKLKLPTFSFPSMSNSSDLQDISRNDLGNKIVSPNVGLATNLNRDEAEQCLEAEEVLIRTPSPSEESESSGVVEIEEKTEHIDNSMSALVSIPATVNERSSNPFSGSGDNSYGGIEHKFTKPLIRPVFYSQLNVPLFNVPLQAIQERLECPSQTRASYSKSDDMEEVANSVHSVESSSTSSSWSSNPKSLPAPPIKSRVEYNANKVSMLSSSVTTNRANMYKLPVLNRHTNIDNVEITDSSRMKPAQKAPLQIGAKYQPSNKSGDMEEVASSVQSVESASSSSSWSSVGLPAPSHKKSAMSDIYKLPVSSKRSVAVGSSEKAKSEVAFLSPRLVDVSPKQSKSLQQPELCLTPKESKVKKENLSNESSSKNVTDKKDNFDLFATYARLGIKPSNDFLVTYERLGVRK